MAVNWSHFAIEYYTVVLLETLTMMFIVSTYIDRHYSLSSKEECARDWSKCRNQSNNREGCSKRRILQ